MNRRSLFKALFGALSLPILAKLPEPSKLPSWVPKVTTDQWGHMHYIKEWDALAWNNCDKIYLVRLSEEEAK